MKLQIVNSQVDLDQCIEDLNSCQEIGLDFEFDKNRFRYGFNICLIQVSSLTHVYIIDPLSKIIDYKELFPVFENPEIVKICYAFNEDLRLLHSLGCFPKNIFDINFAVLFLDYPKTSLGTVILETLGIEVGSSAQKSNWFDRPLSDKQISYAAEDVEYLHQLKEKIIIQASEKGVLEWVEEENERMENRSHENTEDRQVFPEKYKIGINEIQYHILEGLLMIREDLAEKANRPSYMIFHHDVLIDLVKTPNLIHEWTQTKRIHNKYKTANYRSTLIQKIKELKEEAIQLGKSNDKPAKTPLPREEYLKIKAENIRREELRKTEFMPLQKLIVRDYGEFAAPNILGKKAVYNIISHQGKHLANYQIKMAKKYAAEIGLDIEKYLTLSD